MSMKVTKEQFIGMTYDELLAENEKLWVLNEHMGLKDMAVIGGLEKESERLKAENAKLRELVRDYERCTMHANCSRCEYDGKLSTHCPFSPCFPDADELRELGVEQ